MREHFLVLDFNEKSFSSSSLTFTSLVLRCEFFILFVNFIKCNSTTSSQHHSSYRESLPSHSHRSVDSASMGLVHSVVRIFKTSGLTNIKPSLSTLIFISGGKKHFLFFFSLSKFFMTQVRKGSPTWVDPLKTPRAISTFTFL